MICGACGHDNGFAAARCAVCGAPLSPVAERSGDLPLSRGSRRERSFREEARAYPPYGGRPEGAPRGPSRVSGASGGRLSRRERDLNSSGRRPPYGRKQKSPAAFRIMLCVVILLVAAIGAAWGIPRLLENFAKPAAEASAEELIADIEAGVDEQGNAIHTVTFYGEAGDYIYIKELKKNYMIELNNIRVPVPDSLFIPEDPAAATAEVTLHPTLYPLGKKPRELDPVSYTVDIPTAPVKVLMPEEARVRVYRSIYLIKLEVLPGSTVVIDGSDVTDMIDADNVISHNVALEPIGENVIDIRVTAPGYRAATRRIVIDRPYMDIPLELDVNAPTSSTAKRVVLEGKTTPGATLAVAPDSESVEVADDGKFKIRISMNKYGVNTYTITASLPGKQDSTIDHSIAYSPNLDEYSRSAWKMEYEHLVTNQSAFQARIYKCVGVIAETLSENPYIFTFNVAPPGEAEQLIVVEMIKERPVILEPEQQYEIYADLEGEQNGLPRFNGRFLFVATEEKE